MENELQKLDTIIKGALSSAAFFSNDTIPRFDKRLELVSEFEFALRSRQQELSDAMYNIDLAQHGFTKDSIQHYIDKITQPKRQPEPKAEDFVKEINGGYQVYTNSGWIQVSNKASIKVVYNGKGDASNNYKPAVRIEVNDPQTNINFLFEDIDLTTQGNEFLFAGELSPSNDLMGGLPSRHAYWEDPLYTSMKLGSSTGVKVAGALAIRESSNLTPWLKGERLKDAKGWYRKTGGGYNPLSAQRGLGAGGHQVGARAAAQRAKIFKGFGKILFVVSIGMSGYQAFEAHRYDDSNQKEVYQKVTIDIVMAGVGAFGGPVGWVISGTYFIADALGAFGDWGKPSGVRSDGVP